MIDNRPGNEPSSPCLPPGVWPAELDAEHYTDLDEALRALQQASDRGQPPATVTIVGEPKAALLAARQVYARDPLVQMIFLAGDQEARQLRQEMGLAPRIGSYWSIASVESERLPRRLLAAVRSTQQRRQLRTTLDRARVQIASSPPADASDYRRLVLSDRYLAAILTHAHDAILSTDPDGKIRTANPATERLTGFSPHELLSQRLPELAIEQQADNVQEMLQAVAAGKPEARRELRLKRREGQPVDVDVILAPIRDETNRLFGVSAVIRDISERKRAEESLREQREWFQVTLSSIGDAVIATDTRGCVTFLNPVAQTLTGWTQQDAAGKPLETVFHIINEHTRQPVENPVAKVLRDGVIVGLANHTILVARDATERPIDDSAAPIRDREGKIRGVVLVFHDVSERRQIERELHERTERLAEADRRKDEFLALLGHELRNPLSPLRNGLDVLEMHDPSDVALTQKIHSMMARQVDQLVHLVDDLLDVSRVSRGLLKLRCERVELGEIAERAVETMRVMIEERRHALTVQLPDEPVWLEADPVRLEQILCNLLTNATRYTEPGGHIQLIAAREEGWASIRVADTGIGIRPEMMSRIFELFTQADRVTDSVHEGLGLGLTLVKSLTDMHGGKIDVYSEGLGTGSEFIVRLPAIAKANAPSVEPDLPTDDSGNGQLRVLVVDDNLDAARSLAMLLRIAGHDVQTAHDGPQALELAPQHQPDLVFLDIGLPHGMNGYEVAQHLRKESFNGRPLLVALTGFGQESDRRRAKEAGFDAHLVKPAKVEAVREMLARAAHQRRSND